MEIEMAIWKRKSNKLGDNPKNKASWEKKFAISPTVVHKDQNGVETKIIFGWYEERWYYEPSQTGALFGMVITERRPLGSENVTVVDSYNPDPRLYC
jgi:hypothetical protein